VSKDLADFYLKQLRDDCIPFWFPRAVDEEHGGFLHCFDHDGTLVDSDKSVWAQGRMTWMLLALYLDLEARPEWLQWAENGLHFLENRCVDPADGRLFFHVTREGQPIRKRRYAFSETFAAISCAAHAAATRSDRSAARAHECFNRFTDWHFTPDRIPPKFADTRPLTGIGPRMIALVTAQEMELRLGRSPETSRWIDRCLEEMETLFVKPDLQVVMEQVRPDGSISDHFDGRTLNPGHAIENSWFIMEEGRRRNDSRLIRLGCNMLDWMWDRGWDDDHGGIFYFRDLHHGPVQEYWHAMKFWWPHDEALIATLMAHRLTGESRYLDMHETCRKWSFKHFADPVNGEWFGYLHHDGTPSNTLKGNLWKSFFHHPRALFLCHQLARQSPAGPSI
jgi:N-acylglucosamine 2-epimerase